MTWVLKKEGSSLPGKRCRECWTRRARRAEGWRGLQAYLGVASGAGQPEWVLGAAPGSHVRKEEHESCGSSRHF